MDVLHTKESATASEVRAALSDAPSNSAVRTLLRILEEKGHIKHHQEGARFVYAPCMSRESASQSALQRVVSTFFQGSASQAMAALLENADTRISIDELKKLQKMIHQARKEGR